MYLVPSFFYFVCVLSLTLPCCSPLRSCPERPGPQVVLCLGMRNEVRNGVCLCSSRYAKSSRWAELVAVRVIERGRGKGWDISEKKEKTMIVVSMYMYIERKTYSKQLIIHTHTQKKVAEVHASVLRQLSDPCSHTC